MVSLSGFIVDARNSARLAVESSAELGRRIWSLCKPRSVRRGLAAASGVSIGTIMDLRAGRSDPTLSTLLAVAKALDLYSIQELLGEPGTMRFIDIQRDASPSPAASEPMTSEPMTSVPTHAPHESTGDPTAFDREQSGGEMFDAAEELTEVVSFVRA